MLRRKLGQGGFGETWLAEHAKTHDARVFKFCTDAARLKAFQREITLFRFMRETLGGRDDIFALVDWQLDDPRALQWTVRGVVQWLDRNAPVYSVRSRRDPRSLGSDTAFQHARPVAAVALILTAVGPYGVISCSVSEHTQQIGIQVALGAQRTTCSG